MLVISLSLLLNLVFNFPCCEPYIDQQGNRITSDKLIQVHEKNYHAFGYTYVEEAMKEAEWHFKKKIKLPYRQVPLEVTHIFGRFNDLKGEANDSLEISYMDLRDIEGKSNHERFRISLRPVQFKIKLREENNDPQRFVQLKNGTNALYTTTPPAMNGKPTAQIFLFDFDGWQYMFGIPTEITDAKTENMFVEIANSVIGF